MTEMEDSDKVCLADFASTEILAITPFSKKMFLKGSKADTGDQAVIILEKTSFTAEDNADILKQSNEPEILFKNDIYHSLIHFPLPQFTGIKSTVIYPATDDIIKKYTPETCFIVDETEALYKKITLPYITEKHGPPIWVYNILEHKSEAERIIFEDPNPEFGFILLPDLKWDGVKLETLYVQALPHNRNIRTIRDLNADHLPLLRNIAKEGPKIIEEKYNLPKHSLLVYFHYLPSFYHLHVHFKLMQSEGNPGTGTERAHLLSTVIRNIEICPNYYQRATLPVCLRKSEELLSKLQQHEVGDNGN